MSGYCELCGETVCVCTNEPIVTNAMVQRDLQDKIEQLTAESDKQTNCIRAMTEQIAALVQEKEELKRKAEMDYAIMAGDNALITGLKAERNAFQDQCISLKMKMEIMRQERDMLVDALKMAKSYMSRTVPRGPLAADQGIRAINKAEAALAAVEKTK